MPRSRKKRARARAKRAKTGEAELQGIREYGVPLLFWCSGVRELPNYPKNSKK